MLTGSLNVLMHMARSSSALAAASRMRAALTGEGEATLRPMVPAAGGDSGIIPAKEGAAPPAGPMLAPKFVDMARSGVEAACIASSIIFCRSRSIVLSAAICRRICTAPGVSLAASPPAAGGCGVAPIIEALLACRGAMRVGVAAI